MSGYLTFSLILAGAVAVPLGLASLANGCGRYLERRRFEALARLPHPAAAFDAEFRELLQRAGGFGGVHALFGCGHRQRIQLMEKESCFILRNVPVGDALSRNCHGCWLRNGIDWRSIPPRTMPV